MSSAVALNACLTLRRWALSAALFSMGDGNGLIYGQKIFGFGVL